MAGIAIIRDIIAQSPNVPFVPFAAVAALCGMSSLWRHCVHWSVVLSFPSNPEGQKSVSVELGIVAEDIVAGQIDMIPTERRNLAAARADIGA
jgi:hypothetical protein